MRTEGTSRLVGAVLVGGPPRSGTTLLADLMNLNPDLAVMMEYELGSLIADISPIFEYERAVDDVERVLDEQARDLEDVPIDAAVDPAVDDGGPRYSPLPNLNTLITKISRPYPTIARKAEIAAAIVAASLGKAGPKFVGSKNPLFLLSNIYRDVAATYDVVRYVFILRDPLFTINSSINRRNRTDAGEDIWHIRSIVEGVCEYIRMIFSIFELSTRVDQSSILIIKYEDLAADINRTMSSVSDFLGVERISYEEIYTEDRNKNLILTDDEVECIGRRILQMHERWPSLVFDGSAQQAFRHLSQLFGDMASAPVNAYSLPYLAQFLTLGWSSVEPDGCWTDGHHAAIVIPPSDAGLVDVVLTVIPHFPSPANAISLQLSVNDEIFFDGIVESASEYNGYSAGNVLRFGGTEGDIVLRGVVLAPDKFNVIRFEFGGISSPKLQGTSVDARMLGLKLSKLKIIRPAKGAHVVPVDAG